MRMRRKWTPFHKSHHSWSYAYYTLLPHTLTHTIQEAEKLLILAQNHPVKIQIGHVERFNPAFTAVKDMIGEPMFIESHRLAEFNPRGTDVPVVVANPDLIYPVSDGEAAIAIGSIANMFEAVANRKFFRFGKPDVGVFEYAFKISFCNKSFKYTSSTPYFCH